MIYFYFLCFIFSSYFYLSSFWTSRGHRCRSFSPPVPAFSFYGAQGSAFPLLVDFHRNVADSRSRAFLESIWALEKVPTNLYEYALGGTRTNATDLQQSRGYPATPPGQPIYLYTPLSIDDETRNQGGKPAVRRIKILRARGIHIREIQFAKNKKRYVRRRTERFFSCKWLIQWLRNHVSQSVGQAVSQSVRRSVGQAVSQSVSQSYFCFGHKKCYI